MRKSASNTRVKGLFDRPEKMVILLAILSFAFLFGMPAFSQRQGTQGGGITHTKMSNGLEVFAVENHSVPLVTICVVFRGGASAQNPETAGLFHLYEHMLFAGNAKYPTKETFNAALNSMGTTMWNGATGTEFINYHITVPSDTLERGVEFWAAAVKNPIFDPAVFENEKSVVLNEIRGYHADPARIATNALESRMFSEFPWRKNIDGPVANIQSATIDALKAMQSAYYNPSNMALMVGGDCKPEEVLALAEKYFGDWKGAPGPAIGEPPHGKIPAGVKIISMEDLFYRGLAQVQFRWRGPDVLRQTKDTYTSDVLLFLLSSPVGRFKNAIMEKVPGLFDPEYIDFSYPTARDGGNYMFITYLVVQKPSSEGAILDRVAVLEEAVLEEFFAIAADPIGYFGGEELEKAKTKLIDQNIFALESAESFVTDTLTFWWSTATADYFFGYEDMCRAVDWDDISELLGRYIVGTAQERPNLSTLVRVRTSTAGTDFAMSRKIDEHGYLKALPDNAFWWQR